MSADAADEAAEHAWTVPEEATGERLDRHAADRLGEPRNQVQRWIREGRVELNGDRPRSSATVRAGDRVRACPPPPPEGDERLEPEAGELALLHVDEHLIVLDKPPDLAVHPGAGRPTGTLAHRLLGRFPELAGVGGPGRPGIVHRLDLDTSGVMVVARSPLAYQALSRAFARRRVEKTYLAVVHGVPSPAEGRIETPIGRHPGRRKEMTVLPAGRTGARRALTSYRTLGGAPAGGSVGGLHGGPVASLLEVDLGTGRTHQIRVHLKSIGHPLVGDPVYGEARHKGLPGRLRSPLERFPRPALHARRLAFEHPDGSGRVCFEAEVPEDLLELWEKLGGKAEAWA